MWGRSRNGQLGHTAEAQRAGGCADAAEGDRLGFVSHVSSHVLDLCKVYSESREWARWAAGQGEKFDLWSIKKCIYWRISRATFRHSWIQVPGGCPFLDPSLFCADFAFRQVLPLCSVPRPISRSHHGKSACGLPTSSSPIKS